MNPKVLMKRFRRLVFTILLIQSFVLKAQDTTIVVAQYWTNVFLDGFEGSFPGSWDVVGGQGRQWGKSTYKVATGAYSLYCASDGSLTTSSYPNNLISTVEKRNLDFSMCDSVKLKFSYYLNSESGYDYFIVRIRQGAGSWSDLLSTSGGNSTWISQVIDLQGYTGLSNISLQFYFYSNGSNTHEGVWIDDVQLAAFVNGGVTSIDCGAVTPSDSATRTVLIKNSLTQSLSVSNIVNTQSSFDPSPKSFTILPNDSQKVNITFKPTSATSVLDTLKLVTTPATHSSIIVSGISQPVLNVQPAALSLSATSRTLESEQ